MSFALFLGREHRLLSPKDSIPSQPALSWVARLRMCPASSPVGLTPLEDRLLQEPLARIPTSHPSKFHCLSPQTQSLGKSELGSEGLQGTESPLSTNSAFQLLTSCLGLLAPSRPPFSPVTTGSCTHHHVPHPEGLVGEMLRSETQNPVRCQQPAVLPASSLPESALSSELFLDGFCF